jgi:hypothetical protein
MVSHGRQPVGDLRGEFRRLAGRQRAVREPLAQGLALEEFHDGVGGVSLSAEVEDGEDVRVRKRRHGLCLAPEPREGRRLRGERLGQDLGRDVAIQLRVARTVDLAHAPRAERREDLEHAKGVPAAKGIRESVYRIA